MLGGISNSYNFEFVNAFTASDRKKAEADKKMAESMEKEKASFQQSMLEERKGQVEQLRKMAEKNRDSASNIAGSFNPTMEMNKIACASTSAQVRRYMSGVNSKIAILKKSGKYDALIKRFKKLLAKADEKIIKLEREEGLEKKAREMERLKEHKAGDKIRRTKENLKQGRKLQENEDVLNADAITYVEDTASIDAAVNGAVAGGAVAVSVGAEAVSFDISV